MSKKGSDKQINLQNLSIEQLQQLKQSVDQDIDSLLRAYDGLQGAKNRFSDSRNCLEHFKAYPVGQTMLVPMTQSLYVEGEIEDNTHVLVDVGTGYYIKQSVPRAQSFFSQRAGQMDEMLAGVGINVQQKQKQQAQIVDIMMEKARQIEAANGDQK
eukprot:GILI01011922.1.p1 GENE.GILI01011922.1~~GILI01011922.1.p1  ORF type:complete len:156 (-),score=48.44 GILI01011922.1:191-658(-)